MTIDYGEMAIRDEYPDPACNLKPHQPGTERKQQEHEGSHAIGGSFDALIDHARGVFDDCFVEIEKGDPRLNLPYQLSLNTEDGLNTWGYSEWWFNQTYECDTVLITGVDHIIGRCIKKFDTVKNDWVNDDFEFGHTLVDPTFQSKEWASYVGVGNIADHLKNGSIRRIDKVEYKGNQYLYPTLNTAAHEFIHAFLQIDNSSLHGKTDMRYGLQCAGDLITVPIQRDGESSPVSRPARRSYIHSTWLMVLRTGFGFDAENI
jgi:hypothetical protein